MRISVSTVALKTWWPDPHEAATLPEKTGADALEPVLEGSLQPTRINTEPLTDIPTPTVHAPFSDVNPATPNDRHAEQVLQQIEEAARIANELEAQHLTVHPGHLTPVTLNDREKALQLAAERLNQAADLAERHDVHLTVENMPHHPHLLATTPDEIKTLTREAHIGYTLDVGHALTSPTPLPEFLDPRPDVLHIHDNHGDKDEHLPPLEATLTPEDLRLVLSTRAHPVVEVKGIQQARRAVQTVRRHGDDEARYGGHHG